MSPPDSIVAEQTSLTEAKGELLLTVTVEWFEFEKPIIDCWLDLFTADEYSQF